MTYDIQAEEKGTQKSQIDIYSITIIDTIILINYTNDAYTYDTQAEEKGTQKSQIDILFMEIVNRKDILRYVILYVICYML
jgi:hypothetical protein